MSSRLSRNFAALGGGEAVARLVAFAATVYVARQLGPALYGIVGVATGIMLYGAHIVDGGIELTGIPVIARARDRVAAIAGPVLAVRLAIAVVLSLAVIVAGLTIVPQPDGAVLAGYALTLVAAAASTRWVLLGLERTAPVAIARLVGEGATLVLVLLLIHDAGDLGYAPLAAFVGSSLTALLLAASLRWAGVSIPMRSDWPSARLLFARSRYLVGFTLLGLLLYNFDLIFLRFVRGATEAGHYAAAYSLISFAGNLIVAFAHTVMPALARLDDSPSERAALFQSALVQAFAVALPIAVGGHLLAPQIMDEVFGVAFRPGVVALQTLLWTVPLTALREIPVVALIAAEREGALLRVNAITACANIALNVALVPTLGLLGAALATVVSEIVRLALATREARTAGFVWSGPYRLWRPAAAALITGAALLVFKPRTVWLAVPLAAVAYAGAIGLVGGVRRGQSGGLELRL